MKDRARRGWSLALVAGVTGVGVCGNIVPARLLTGDAPTLPVQDLHAVAAMPLEGEVDLGAGPGTDVVTVRFPAPPVDAAWSPDGHHLAVATGDGVEIRDEETSTVEGRLVGHQGAVLAVAWSPDGSRLATASADGTARTWSREGVEGVRLEGHDGQVNGVAWSPDGVRVATGGLDGTVRVWDAATGQAEGWFVASETLHSVGNPGAGDGLMARQEWSQVGAVLSVAWSPDGQEIATGAEDGTARVWSWPGGTECERLEVDWSAVTSVAWRPDGGALLVGASRGAPRTWVPGGPEAPRLLETASPSVVAAWSPDGASVIVGTEDRVVRVLDGATGRVQAEMGPGSTPDWRRMPPPRTVYGMASWSPWITGYSNDGLRALAVHPDGRRITWADASALRVRTWDLARPDLQRASAGRSGGVRAVAWSPDGRRVVAGSRVGALRAWDAASGEEVVRAEGHVGEVTGVAWSPDGARWASGGQDDTLRVWDAASGAEVLVVRPEAGDVRGVAWTPDGRSVLAAVGDRVCAWDPVDGTERSCLADRRESKLAVAADPTSGRIATAAMDGVRLWNAATGTEETTLVDGRRTPSAVAWSPDGRLLAAGLDGGDLLWWDTATAAEVGRVGGIMESVRSVSWSPDGTGLAACSDDGSLRVVDVASATTRSSLSGATGTACGAAWSPDGTRVAWALASETIRITSAATGAEIQRLGSRVPFTRAMDWSRDGAHLAVGTGDGEVRILDAATGEEVRRIEGAAGGIREVAWSPDGSRLALGGTDGAVRVWPAWGDREERRWEVAGASVQSVAWHPEGDLLTAGASDGSVRSWSVATGSEVLRTTSPNGWVGDVAWNERGSILVLATAGRETVFLGRDGQPLSPPRSEADRGRGLDSYLGLNQIAWVPREERLLAGTRLGLSQVSVATESLTPGTVGPDLMVQSLAVSPRGSRAAVGSETGAVAVVDLDHPDDPVWLEGLTALVVDVAWSPDGERVAACGGTACRIWEAQTGRPLLEYSPGPEGAWYAWDAAGSVRWAQREPDLQAWRDLGQGWIDLAPPVGSTPMSLQVEAEPVEVKDTGLPVRTLVTVRNAGNTPVFEVRLLLVGPLPPGLTVTPETWRSRLEPGESIQIPVLVHWLHPMAGTAAPAAPSPWEVEVPLTLRTLQGDTPAPPLPIRIATAVPVVAELEIQTGPDGQASGVRVTLANEGVTYDEPLRVLLRFLDASGTVLAETPAQDLKLLPASGSLDPLSFTLPADVAGAWQAVRVQAVVTGSLWPTHRWATAPRPIPTGSPWGAGLSLALCVVVLGAGGIGWLGVFRHPDVVRLTASPASIHAFPATLARSVDRALRRARRLDWVLREAGVPAPRWRALLAVASGDATPLARVLGATCGVPDTQPDGLVVLPVELPAMPVKIEARTALLARTGMPATHLPDAIRAVVESRRLESAHILLVDLSPEQDASAALAGTFLRTCVLDARDTTDVMLHSDPRHALGLVVARSAKLGEISPYQTGGGVDNPLLFFGRTSELALLGGRGSRNHLLIGARQMGKSSILKELRRRNPERTSHVTLTGGDLDTDLVRGGLPPLDGLEALPATDEPRLILLDEADLLVRADRVEGYPLLRRLRALSEAGRCRFVLAGYWQLHHAAYLEHQAPIRNFGEPLRLEPLDPDAAWKLATLPLAPLGVRWDPEADLVPDLLRRTGRRANLLSIACNAAVKSLPPLSDRRLTREILEAVLDVSSRSGREVADALADRGSLTAEPRDSAIDLLCQFAALDLPSPFTRADLRARLDALGALVPERDLREALERLLLTYTWTMEDGALSWPVPLVRDVLLVECDRDAAGMAASLAREAAWR